MALAALALPCWAWSCAFCAFDSKLVRITGGAHAFSWGGGITERKPLSGGFLCCYPALRALSSYRAITRYFWTPFETTTCSWCFPTFQSASYARTSMMWAPSGTFAEFQSLQSSTFVCMA